MPGINMAPVAIGRGGKRCKQLQEAIAGREKSVLSMAAICGRDLWKSGIQVSVFSSLIKKPCLVGLPPNDLWRVILVLMERKESNQQTQTH